MARTIDGYERELGEGPCLDAIVDNSVYHDADLTDGSPWPRLTERVLATTPVRSMAGFRLLVGDQKSGALNLFSETPGGLDDDSVDQGIVLASFVTVALLAAHERKTAETLRAGLASNREIGKAIGLMMAFHKISDEDAFAMLRKRVAGHEHQARRGRQAGRRPPQQGLTGRALSRTTRRRGPPWPSRSASGRCRTSPRPRRSPTS